MLLLGLVGSGLAAWQGAAGAHWWAAAGAGRLPVAPHVQPWATFAVGLALTLVAAGLVRTLETRQVAARARGTGAEADRGGVAGGTDARANGAGDRGAAGIGDGVGGRRAAGIGDGMGNRGAAADRDVVWSPHARSAAWPGDAPREASPADLVDALGRHGSGAAARGDRMAPFEAGVPADAPPVGLVEGADDEATLATDHPLRILLVEDDPVDRQVALSLLDLLGYRPHVVTDGAAAVDAVTALAGPGYDLVLLADLPGLDEIRMLIKGGPRVVTMGAAAGSTAEWQDHVLKPLRSDELRQVLESTPRRELVQETPAVWGGRAPWMDPQGMDVVDVGVPVEVGWPAAWVDVADAQSEEVCHLDVAALEALAGQVGGMAKVRALAVVMEEETPHLLLDIEAGLAAGDPRRVHGAAHTIRSLAAMFGAPVVCALAEDLEHRAREEDLVNGESLLLDLMEAYGEAVEELRAFLKE